MSDLAQMLYQKFFLHDFLGKIAPAVLFVVTLAWLFRGRISVPAWSWLADRSSKVTTAFLGFGVLWLLGFAFETMSQWPIRAAAPYPEPSGYLSERFYLLRLALFAPGSGVVRNADHPITVEQVIQRERFVAIKEATGNSACAIVVAVGLFWCFWLLGRFSLVGIDRWWALADSVGLLLLVVLLAKTQYEYRTTQAAYEISVLANAGLPDDASEEMWRNAKLDATYGPWLRGVPTLRPLSNFPEQH